MKNRRNYYRLLHVGPEAPTAVIQASYRTLMQRLKMHPDLGGDHAQAALLNEAYATLSDPDRRAAYDRTLARASQQRRGTKPPPPPRDGPRAPRPSAAPSPSNRACVFCTTPCPAIQAEHPDGTCARCGSALARAPKHRWGNASRRAIERVPRNMPVTFAQAPLHDVVSSGTTEDVSLNGMRLLSRVNLPVGARLKIECTFCSAVGVVRSTHPLDGLGHGGWQASVEFLTLRIKHERGGLFSTVA